VSDSLFRLPDGAGLPIYWNKSRNPEFNSNSTAAAASPFSAAPPKSVKAPMMSWRESSPKFLASTSFDSASLPAIRTWGPWTSLLFQPRHHHGRKCGVASGERAKELLAEAVAIRLEVPKERLRFRRQICL